MKKQLRHSVSLALALLMTASLAFSLFILPATAEEIVMEPLFEQPFQPEGVTFGQVSFIVPGGTQGLTKDAWDGNIDYNTDLILLSYVKDGELYVGKTIREIKEHLGNLALVRTCYTYEDMPDGTLRLNLVFHMDDHASLKPADIVAVTVKAGFVWCAGSPSGISGELTDVKLNREVSFPTKGEAGITAVQDGPMPGPDGALRVKFDRKDTESLKAISAVDLCPSAIPGKTLGDLVTINGVTYTQLVAEGKVARFNFYGDTMVFHIDDPAYLSALKNEGYEIVILPGFRWMTWHQDDWGNWAGTNKNNYTPVENSLVTSPISFRVNANDEIVIPKAGISIEPGYKDTYFVGESIDMTTLMIRVNYPNGKSETMFILESMVSYDFSAEGEATVTVTVQDMTATYTVTVIKDPNATEAPTDAPTEPVTEPVTEPATTPMTDPATEVPTAAPTDAPTEAPTDGGQGCASALALLPVALMPIAAALILKKKEEAE